MTKEPYKGLVYNLKTGTATFTAPFAFVHNCSWGFFEKHYTGKRPEYRVRIGPGDARSRGLLKEVEQNGWPKMHIAIGILIGEGYLAS